MNIDITKQIRIKDFEYPLPDERIAKFPLEHRDESKLLLYNHGKITEDIFYNLPNYLTPGELMVMNNTRVIQARLIFHKPTGARIEIFCLEPAIPADYVQNFQQTDCCSWYCMVGNMKKWKGEPLQNIVEVNGQPLTFTATLGGTHGTSYRVDFAWDNHQVGFADILEAIGQLPIPPYLKRETEEKDKETYQTVYAKIKGSVAAPTAGLHFTDRVLHGIDARGVEREEVTLHVGAGTFKPVKSAEIADHEMHTEFLVVNRKTIQRLMAHNAQCLAVGTTSVRTLESLYYMAYIIKQHPDAEESELHIPQWIPYEQPATMSPMEALQIVDDYMERHELPVLRTSTQILIAPGYEYKIVKKLITNFHMPQSTLLLLVSAFIQGNWRAIYQYALQHDFRFLSYGDSSLLIP